jgi:predicted MPP superfamily phosphohydrolase
MQMVGIRVPRGLWLGVLVTALICVLAVAASFGDKQVDVVRHDLRASADLQPIRLVQISDLHLKAFGAHEQGLAAQLIALAPDVVVLSGDAVDRADALPLLQTFVRAFAPVPVLLVPGNWEHWSGLDFIALQTMLATSGGQLLLNERWSFSRGDRSLLIIGLDDDTAGRPDLQLLDSRAPSKGALTVVVQHSPAFFDKADVAKRMANQRFDLCLAGHTHGGQLAIGGWAPIRPVGSGRFIAGFYDVPGCSLFVSRGTGTSVLPFRLGARAEVVVFDL